MPDHRHLQVEETHEEETSIPQVGWSWTIPPLDPILIHQYQLLDNLIEVMHESHIQSQKKAENKNPLQTLGFLVGLLAKDQPADFFFVDTCTSSYCLRSLRWQVWERPSSIPA